MQDLVFKLNSVYFSYLGKFPALSDISMDIATKQKIVILGANGTGKSTLLQLLDGLIFPDRGTIHFCGRLLDEEALTEKDFVLDFRSRVGFVFQNPDVQLFCPTVEEDVIFGPLQLGLDKGEIAKRLDKYVNLLSLADLLKRSPHQLSVGEKRKVSIASTLIMNPDVLLLDEPTAGLDPQTARQIVDIIIEENENGKTIITATHDLHIVEEIADIVYVLNRQKKVAKYGPAQELLKDLEVLQNNNLMHIHKHSHKDATHIHPHQHIDHHG